MIASFLLSLTLFLLSADLLHLEIEGNKIKYGYLLILALWLFKPDTMLASAREAIRSAPKWILIVLVPLAISIAMSVDPVKSLLWSFWLGFDAFTVVTIYAFLRVHQFSCAQVQRCATLSLGLIALCGMAQFVAIYGFHHVIFEPQFHFNLFRLNGVSGWPLFLNIFCFLLLPLALLQQKVSRLTPLVLVFLVFVLVQSTAKAGWVLFVALGVLLWRFDRKMFAQRFLGFMVPITALALILPTPSADSTGHTVNGTEKIARFAADLNLADRWTSGTDRVLISELGLKVWTRHPWFGVGPKAYSRYIYERFDQEFPGASKYDATNQVIAKNENIWVEMLVENGLLFTLGFVLVLIRALWVPGWSFANRLHLGAWIALVMYFVLSGQVSQTALLTMVYAVLGIYFYAREQPADETKQVNMLDATSVASMRASTQLR